MAARGACTAGYAYCAGWCAWSIAGSVPAVKTAYPSFSAELRKLGFQEGRNLLLEYRSYDQGPPQATAAVKELIEWKANALFVISVEFALYGIPSLDPCRWRRSGRREER